MYCEEGGDLPTTHFGCAVHVQWGSRVQPLLFTSAPSNEFSGSEKGMRGTGTHSLDGSSQSLPQSAGKLIEFAVAVVLWQETVLIRQQAQSWVRMALPKRSAATLLPNCWIHPWKWLKVPESGPILLSCITFKHLERLLQLTLVGPEFLQFLLYPLSRAKFWFISTPPLLASWDTWKADFLSQLMTSASANMVRVNCCFHLIDSVYINYLRNLIQDEMANQCLTIWAF